MLFAEMQRLRDRFLGGEIEFYDKNEDGIIRGPIKDIRIDPTTVTVIPEWMADPMGRGRWKVITDGRYSRLSFPLDGLRAIANGRLNIGVQMVGSFTLSPQGHKDNLDHTKVEFPPVRSPTSFPTLTVIK